MKKRNWIFKIASCLMMACLLTTCVISGTFAKFTSQASGSTTVKVATWEFTLNGTKQSEEFAINLGATVDTVDGNTDNEVDLGDDLNVIAPGTKGSFSIELVNNSQVSASYAVSFAYEDASNAPANLKFCATENGTYSTLADLGTALDGTLKYKNDANNDDQTTITVYWKWEFTDTDETSYAGNEIVINATIDLTQVD